MQALNANLYSTRGAMLHLCECNSNAAPQSLFSLRAHRSELVDTQRWLLSDQLVGCLSAMVSVHLLGRKRLPKREKCVEAQIKETEYVKSMCAWGHTHLYTRLNNTCWPYTEKDHKACWKGMSKKNNGQNSCNSFKVYCRVCLFHPLEDGVVLLHLVWDILLMSPCSLIQASHTEQLCSWEYLRLQVLVTHCGRWSQVVWLSEANNGGVGGRGAHTSEKGYRSSSRCRRVCTRAQCRQRALC